MTRTLLLITLLLGSRLSAATVWLDWTGAGGAAGLTGSFPGSAALSGTVTATRSGAIDGGTALGIPGPAAQTITTLTPTFLSTYGPGNPGLSFIGNSYNDTGDVYTVTIDFSGLAGGGLPSSALFAFVDYDITESLRNLTAFTTGGIQITSPWLISVGGAAGYLDANSVGGDQSGAMPVPAPALTSALGVYQLISDAGNMDSGFYAFHTNTLITRITYEHYLNTGNRPGGGGGGIAIGVEQTATPEPGSWALMLSGGALLAFARRRKR